MIILATGCRPLQHEALGFIFLAENGAEGRITHQAFLVRRF
jgi:hypothetical protein